MKTLALAFHDNIGIEVETVLSGAQGGDVQVASRRIKEVGSSFMAGRLG